MTLLLEPLSSLDSVADDWARLAEATGNIFATWEWNSLWWKHFGRGRELLVTVCRDGAGTIVAILPLYLSTERPLRVLRFLGHGQGDHLSPICAPADREAAALATRKRHAETADDRIELHRHRIDFLIDHRQPGAVLHPLRVVLWVEEADVVLDRADEQVIVLHHNADPAAVGSLVPVSNVTTGGR